MNLIIDTRRWEQCGDGGVDSGRVRWICRNHADGHIVIGLELIDPGHREIPVRSRCPSNDGGDIGRVGRIRLGKSVCKGLAVGVRIDCGSRAGVALKVDLLDDGCDDVAELRRRCIHCGGGDGRLIGKRGRSGELTGNVAGNRAGVGGIHTDNTGGELGFDGRAHQIPNQSVVGEGNFVPAHGRPIGGSSCRDGAKGINVVEIRRRNHGCAGEADQHRRFVSSRSCGREAVHLRDGVLQ